MGVLPFTSTACGADGYTSPLQEHKGKGATIMKLAPRRVESGAIVSTALLALVVLMLGACANMATPSLTASNAAVLDPQRIARIVASPDRSAADRNNDQRRKPEQMLAFIGIWPGMVALDISAAGGYTTELLARAVGLGGRVYGQSESPRGPEAPPRPTAAAPEGDSSPSASTAVPIAPVAPSPPTVRRTSAQALAERAKNPVVANIVAVLQPFEDPVPPALAAGGLDLVTLMFNYHDLGWMGTDRARMNKAVFAGLKRGGVYVIADHSGRPGTGISEAGTLHRIEEAFLRQEVEAAGFKFADQGNFLRNPSDPRDKNTPNPPQPKDEFVLKFVKP